MENFCIALHFAIFCNVKHLGLGKVNSFQQILLCLSPVRHDLGGFLNLCHLKSHWAETCAKNCQPCCFFFFNVLFITSIYLLPQIKSSKKRKQRTFLKKLLKDSFLTGDDLQSLQTMRLQWTQRFFLFWWLTLLKKNILKPWDIDVWKN